MKKIITLIIVAVCCTTMNLYAQANGKDPKAKAILDDASAKFKTFKSFKATFTYIHTNASVPEMNEEWNGSVTVKGDKYVLSTDQGLKRYCNGELTYIYLTDENEVTIDNVEDDEMGSFNVGSMVDMYKDGYKYVLVGQEKVHGVLCDIIDLEPDLTPEQRKTNQVFKIRVHIDHSSKVLKQWKVFEKNGNRFLFDITKFSPNVSISDSAFTFDVSAHPNVLVTDLSKD